MTTPAATASARVAVVTGAGSGIGSAIAEELAARGLHVAVADVDDRGAAATVARITAAGGRGEPVHLDVTDADAVTAALDALAARHGRLDVLVNNAGVFTGEAPVETTELAVWRRTVEVNLSGAFICARAAVPHLKRAGGGRIVNIASRAWLGAPNNVAYSASKGGIVSLTRALAIELGPAAITVNTVSPTAIETPMHHALPPEEQAEVMARIGTQPIARLGRPEEVAFAVAFFVEERASYLTGQHLYVGGGTELRSSAIQ